MSQPLHISHHAVIRYRERVAPGASYAEARMALTRFVSLGRRRSTPRWWMKGKVKQGPGVRFCYFAERPDACAIVVENTVVTVVNRAMCAASPKPAPHLHAVSPAPRPTLASERARWRWDGNLETEAA